MQPVIAGASGTARGPSPALTFLLAAACGLLVANVYYAQPLISLIAPDIGLPPGAASLIVTTNQFGYCLGLLLLVPLGDLLPNRRLILVTQSGACLALLSASWVHGAPAFLSACFAIGLCSVVVQMLVPLAAHLAPDAIRGQVVGRVMSGLLIGIMLARPTASMITALFGWRAVFAMSSALTAALVLLLLRTLPERIPPPSTGYLALLGSLWTLLRDTPLLRRRAAYQAALFAAFSVYWTAVPLLLAGPHFGFSQRGIAVFALTGVAGALAAPVAGRLADRGRTHVATAIAMALVAVGMLLGLAGAQGSLAALLMAGVLMDLGVQANLVLGQRAIYSLGGDMRSRLTGLFLAIFFVGGAFGSALASPAFQLGGWALVSTLGAAFPLLALVFYASEGRPPRMAPSA